MSPATKITSKVTPRKAIFFGENYTYNGPSCCPRRLLWYCLQAIRLFPKIMNLAWYPPVNVDLPILPSLLIWPIKTYFCYTSLIVCLVKYSGVFTYLMHHACQMFFSHIIDILRIYGWSFFDVRHGYFFPGWEIFSYLSRLIGTRFRSKGEQWGSNRDVLSRCLFRF